MKTLWLAPTIFFGVVLMAAPSLAQQQVASIPQLKEQIQKLEAVASAEAAAPDVKELNSGFLKERRLQLHTALRKRADALQKYLAAAASALTAEEVQTVQKTIDELRADSRSLERAMGSGAADTTAATSSAVAAPTETRPAPAFAGRIIPAALDTRGAPAVGTATAVSPAPSVAAAAAFQAGGGYPNAPEVLATKVDRVAAQIASTGQVAPLSSQYPELFLYAVSDAVGAQIEFKAARNWVETARTDKQIEAPASAEAGTSKIEKPGAAILSLAVENGVIEQDTRNSLLTLTTTPYKFAKFNRDDTAELFQEEGLLDRVSLSAVFNMSDQTNALANARRSQFSQGSVRFQFYGDRNPRSRKFVDFWRVNIRPSIQRRLNAVGNALSVLDADDTVRALSESSEDPLRARLRAYLTDPANTGKTEAVKQQEIKNIILSHLRTTVFEPVDGGTVVVNDTLRRQIVNDLIPRVAETTAAQNTARELLDKKLDDFMKGPIATFAYTLHRQADASDYSELKLLFEQDNGPLRPLKLVANTALTFYHNPNPALNQQQTRDFTAALSFEAKTRSPFLQGTDDLSRITFAFTGNYRRLFENRGVAGRKADIAYGQFKVQLPIYAGVSFPFSVTYANATELIKEDHVRANFGFSFDADKLFALTRALPLK